jgi:type VI protein secretion system component Hcp
MVKFFMILKCNYYDLSFLQYLNSHIEINSLKCSISDVSFSQKNLKRDIERIYLSFKCIDCDSTLSQKQDMNRHTELVNKGNK